MTSERWEHATINEMIAFLGWQENGVARKRRLYHIALFQQFCAQLNSPVAGAAVAAAEKFVDGQLSLDELQTSYTALFNEWIAAVTANGGKRYIHTRPGRVYAFAMEACSPVGCMMVLPTHRVHVEPATRFLRDIFGNRVRKVPFGPRWRTSDVVGLARAIYEDRAFERMPILADALMDAGCENEEIIGHCRGNGPHVRGCWVVDLIFEKT